MLNTLEPIPPIQLCWLVGASQGANRQPKAPDPQRDGPARWPSLAESASSLAGSTSFLTSDVLCASRHN